MKLSMEKKSVWEIIDEKEREHLFSYNEEYKEFLDKGKTEREVVEYIIAKGKEEGYISLEEAIEKKIQKGDKIYLNNRNKSCALFVIGEDLEQGMRIVASHIDSPRLDLKVRPLYEDSEMALLKTHYYGGIRKYQWPTIPLALHGIAYDKEGNQVKIVIGEEEGDPIFFINDLLPHLGADQSKKTLAEGITGEMLNVVIGHSPKKGEEKHSIKEKVLELLNEKYNLVEEDFQVAELSIVPAFKAKDVGLDRSMVAAYGQDDRVCSFANLKAILEVDAPKETAVAIFADKEEIGSVGNTSMSAKFFENAVAEIVNAMGDYSELKVRRALANSKVISADVTSAMDPSFKEVMDEKNSAFVGHGITLIKYTGSRGKSMTNDANAEFLVEVRERLNKEKVVWQTGTMGKVDQGGGGTVAYILAEYGAEVVDMGTAMLSMHAPYELVSKADSYMTYKGYLAFIK
ncbi:aminopeptidase [Peptoniphilus sp. KCTC 25270]|uniref:aminopeptidase n=1 Tax=Peptoniphilus sp. KCTC 25270 TaxID=2897414 RepID=UPI001E2F1640|nr:aminopeptidase [Peptoniphilus sp. KCTC 25270]MCD1146889.1 aminopeptidase [Peptoniphilus sp. KCTC 25270]